MGYGVCSVGDFTDKIAKAYLKYHRKPTLLHGLNRAFSAEWLYFSSKNKQAIPTQILTDAFYLSHRRK